jgi:hypothetical protein
MLSCLHKQVKSQFETTRNALFGTPTIESLIGNNKRARVLQEFLLLNAIGRGDLDARPPLKGCFLMFNVIQADFHDLRKQHTTVFSAELSRNYLSKIVSSQFRMLRDIPT